MTLRRNLASAPAITDLERRQAVQSLIAAVESGRREDLDDVMERLGEALESAERIYLVEEWKERLARLRAMNDEIEERQRELSRVFSDRYVGDKMGELWAALMKAESVGILRELVDRGARPENRDLLLVLARKMLDGMDTEEAQS